MALDANWWANDSDRVAIPEDRFRDELVLEQFSGSQVWFAKNQAAAVNNGLSLTEGKAVMLTGKDAQAEIHMICDTGNSATGGYWV